MMLVFAMLVIHSTVLAQGKLSIENVRSTYLRNSGTIVSNGEIKGYYAFYLSDKIDKHTNEYTVQITDENLNKIKDIKFEDNKNIQILESSYNGSTIMFLFYDDKEKTLEYRSYGFDGKQKSSYVKELNKRSKQLLEETYGTSNEDGQNEALFDIEDVGYVTVFPVKEGKYYSYEVNYFFTDRKKQWTYEAAEEQDDKWAKALYLGHTDSLVLFEVVKQRTLLGGSPHSWLLALNMFTGQKAFEMSTETEADYRFYPTNISTINGQSNFLIMGTYYDKDDNVMKRNSLGLAAWTMDSKGKIISKKYNSWADDIGKHLKTTEKGNVEGLGYVYFHRIIQTADGKFFAIGEGYRKELSAGATALNVLAALGGGHSKISSFKIVVTEMIMMEFNNKFEVKAATIYEKFNNNVILPAGAGYMSPHALAIMVKAWDGFDYDFTQMDKSHANFVVGYSDYEKSKDYKGITFNSISYYDNKISTDKIKLNSKASKIRIFPAKTGSVMIMEYYKKDKRLEFRLEKLN